MCNIDGIMLEIQVCSSVIASGESVHVSVWNWLLPDESCSAVTVQRCHCEYSRILGQPPVSLLRDRLLY